MNLLSECEHSEPFSNIRTSAFQFFNPGYLLQNPFGNVSFIFFSDASNVRVTFRRWPVPADRHHRALLISRDFGSLHCTGRTVSFHLNRSMHLSYPLFVRRILQASNLPGHEIP
jgi:hypothetical protein